IGATPFNQEPFTTVPKIEVETATNVVHVTRSNINEFSLQVGNNIAPYAFITVPVAYDAAGNPIEFVQYSIPTVAPALYSTTGIQGAPVPADVVAAAYRYAATYVDPHNENDCGFIAQDVAAAAGASMVDTSYAGDPRLNTSGGFWRVVYRGTDPNPHQHW